MIVTPYKRAHTKGKRIAFVTNEGEYVTEDGAIIQPEIIGNEYRCFCTWETARKLTVDDGIGEMLTWHSHSSREVIRWRPLQFPNEDTWVNRPFDAYVIRCPMYAETDRNLEHLCFWRDWLWEYRVHPGTMGSTSLRLLRATIRKALFTSQGWDKLRIRQSAGGIIRLGADGQGEFTGRIVHHDLPAAYASGLGHLRYGGRWHEQPNLTAKWLTSLVRKGVPVYVRAKVYVPSGLLFGPLPIRPRKPLHPMRRDIYNRLDPHDSRALYPVGKTIQGVWTFEEIQAAKAAGCAVRILAAWHHSSPLASPFRYWWRAIEGGREMPGLAGLLAKITGNSLWGMFALDPTTTNHRSITRRTKHKGGRIKSRVIDDQSGFLSKRIAAIDLAEIVAGRVRAELYEALLTLGGDWLSAHTDGLWAYKGENLTGEWREKEAVQRLQLLSPQHMRYWPHGSGKPVTMYSGVPYEHAEESFDLEWGKFVTT